LVRDVYLVRDGVPGVRTLLAAWTRVEAAGVIAPLGVEIAFLVASLGAAVVAAVVAMEMQRNPFVWAIISFFVTFIVASAVHAML
jgi:hypothetical protein